MQQVFESIIEETRTSECPLPGVYAELFKPFT